MTGKRRRIKGWYCTAFNNFSISICTASFVWYSAGFCSVLIYTLMLGKR